MTSQHTHFTTPFSKRRHSIVLVCDGVTGPANLGGMFRLSDAFGVEKLIVGGAGVNLDSPRLRKAARDTLGNTPYKITNHILDEIEQLRGEDYRICGLEITSKSISIQQFINTGHDKIALIIGSEQHGISRAVLQQLDATFHIEMFGTNSSMNVTHAAAVALFEFTKT